MGDINMSCLGFTIMVSCKLGNIHKQSGSDSIWFTLNVKNWFAGVTKFVIKLVLINVMNLWCLELIEKNNLAHLENQIDGSS